MSKRRRARKPKPKRRTVLEYILCGVGFTLGRKSRKRGRRK